MDRVSVVEGGSLGIHQIARLLGMQVAGEVRVGYGSSGAPVSDEEKQWFLRLPCLNGDDPEELLRSYFDAGVPGVARVVVISPSGEIKELSYEANDPNQAVEIKLGEVAAVAMLLQLLPEGKSLTEVMSKSSYFAFGQELKRWHSQPVRMTDEQTALWR